MAALATIVAVIILWGVVSRPLDRRGITSAMVFVGAGFLVGSSALGLLDTPVESEAAQLVTQVALVLLLFSAAARLDLRALRHQLTLPTRLVRAHQRWYDAHAEVHPEAAEAEAATMPRPRRHLSAADLARLRGADPR